MEDAILGVITGKQLPDKNQLVDLIDEFDKAFESTKCSKNNIVGILKSYLLDFEYIEIGKALMGRCK